MTDRNADMRHILSQVQRLTGGTVVEAEMPTGQRDPSAPVYLRVGTWNPDRPISKNYATGSQEAGLSVYELDRTGKPIVPSEGEWAEDDMQDRLASSDPKFLVQGMVVGRGGDGEPVLDDVRVVGTWHPVNESAKSIVTMLTEAPYDRYNQDEATYADTLKGVEDYAASIGVELRASVQTPQSARDHIHGAGWALAWVKRETGEKGSAVKAIQRLAAVADENKQKIALMVMADDAPLVPYYEKLGFKVAKKNREGTTMVRAVGGKSKKTAYPDRPPAHTNTLKPGTRVVWSTMKKHRPNQRLGVEGTVTEVEPFEVPGDIKSWVNVKWDDGLVTDGVHNESLSVVS